MHSAQRLAAWSLPLLAAAAAAPGGLWRAPAAGGAAEPASVTVDLSRPLSRFRPDRALGAGVDGHERGHTRLIYTRPNLRAMRSAGLGPLAYRLRTELGVEAWHWNPRGRWSDPRRRQGYWTSSSRPGRPFATSYGYRLPRRGNTIDQANDDGYSRLDDGSLRSFWKSNPYLDPHYTRQSERAHPQWILIDLQRPQPVDSVRIAWARPYARAVRVEYFVGDEAIYFAEDPSGYWRPFPNAAFHGRGGTRTLRLAREPLQVRFIRVLMYRSSHTGPRGSRDLRDRLGFAVREVGAGTQTAGRFNDLVRHRRSRRQTVTYASSTDPWHRARDLDRRVEQPSFHTIQRSGLLNRQPMLAAVPVLYGTPDDAAAELRYLHALRLPVRRVELGEEPDGQLVTPEDYGALYAQVARALRRVDKRVKLGGPGYQTAIPDWMMWPDKPGGEVSWTRRFLRELRRNRAARELGFFSFEWYPFDDGCGDPAQQLVEAPQLLDDVLAAQRREGLPRGIPTVITEYGYSAFATRHMVDLPGALLNADIVGRFLRHGGHVAYLYGYEPDGVFRELSKCSSWGNLILFRADESRRIRQPVATYWAARMLTRDWAGGGRGPDRLYPAEATPRDALGRQLLGVYALRRPDGRLALLFVNRDPRRAWRLELRTRRKGPEQRLAQPLEVSSLSAAQYVWHPRGRRGFARPDRPPARTRLAAGSTVTVAPWSLTVVRTR